MHKLNSIFLVCLLALTLPLSAAFGSQSSSFSQLPNALKKTERPTLKSIEFGSDVVGVFVPKSVLTRCECLLVWNGANWNEDAYYTSVGNSVLENKGFYRPYNHSPIAYSIELSQKEWLKVKQTHQFSKTFSSKEFKNFSVVQLDSPHAPFVYVEMNLNGALKVFRLETPQDLSPNIEAWLKKASFTQGKNYLTLSLAYDLYQTGSGQDPKFFTVRYQFENGNWYAQPTN